MQPTLAVVEPSVTEIPVSALAPGMVIMIDGNPEIVLDKMGGGFEGQYLYTQRENSKLASTPKHHLDPTYTVYQTVPGASVEKFIRSIPLENLSKPAFTSNYSGTTTIGTDPEIFVEDSEGRIIPAFAFLPKKTNVFYESPVIAFYDGFQAEFVTKPPTCLGYLTDYVREGLQRVLDAARKLDSKAKLSYRSVAEITHCDANAIDPSHYQLGCAPSENAYGDEHLKLDNPEMLPFRFAGWHMHFSLSNRTSLPITKENAPRIVKMMDRILGVASVCFGNGFTDPRRRQFYGRAGEYRLGKTLEYRVPDVIMGAHPATFNLLWDLGRVAMHLGVKGFDFLFDGEDEEVRAAINGYDVGLARKILERNKTLVLGMLTSAYGNTGAVLGYRTLTEGIETVVADPTAIEKNWHLDGFGEPAWTPEREGHRSDCFWRGTAQISFPEYGKV